MLVPMILEKDGKPLALDEVITVGQFEDMTRELMERTHHPIEVVLADSGVLASEIDRVILVGGSTRMPLVTKDIKSFLNMEPSRSVNPDYAVAEGAAIQAGIIQGSIRQEDSILMTDVNPYTLGVRVMDWMSSDRMGVVIPRNVTIPTTRNQVYSTSADYQDTARIEVYQGESDIASHNHFLGEFVVQGIPRKAAGNEKIGVEFTYNLNGMLEVSASILSTGKQAGIQINMMENNSEEEIIDVSNWKDSPYAKQFRTIVRRVEKLLQTPETHTDPFWAEDLEDSLYELKAALVRKDLESAKEAEEELIDMLSYE